MMQPVRIKVYGLLPMTRQTYLTIQLVGLVIVLAMMAVGAAAMLWAGTILPWLPEAGGNPPQDIHAVAPLLVWLFWLGLLILFGESIETYLVLRKFGRAEEEQRATLAAAELVEPVSHSAGVQLPPSEHPNTNIQS